MAISIDPILPVFPVLPAQEAGAVAPELLLQPGAVIDATVLKVLAADLVRIAIASLSIDVRSEIPLREGEVLRLSVSQTESGIRLTPVGEGEDAGAAADAVTLSPDAPVEAPVKASASASPKTVLTPLEKMAVTVAAQAAATEQGSQAPLFANLGAVAATGALPPKLQQAVAQVLSQQPRSESRRHGYQDGVPKVRTVARSLAGRGLGAAYRWRARSQGRADRLAANAAVGIGYYGDRSESRQDS